jgi:putative chitinase
MFPNAKNIDTWVFAINTLCLKNNIMGMRLAQFLAQCGHESAGFTVFNENLNYSAAGLLKVFPRHFDEASATQYARNPVRIANRVYANRMSNGNEASGDGWKFRGRGPLQCTGRDNYNRFSRWYFGDTRLIDDPDQLLDPMVGIAFTCWFWETNRLNTLADREDTLGVTRRINGGTHGIDDRRRRYDLAKKVLNL